MQGAILLLESGYGCFELLFGNILLSMAWHDDCEPPEGGGKTTCMTGDKHLNFQISTLKKSCRSKYWIVEKNSSLKIEN
jgi:hypothetical protein